MVTFGIRAGICIFSTLVMIFGGIGILLHLREQAQMMSELAPFIKKQKKVFTLLLLQVATSADQTINIVEFHPNRHILHSTRVEFHSSHRAMEPPLRFSGHFNNPAHFYCN